MKKVAIYARVSTDNDTQFFDRQITDLTNLIKTHHYSQDQIETYTDKLSGYKKDRPSLTKMLSEIETSPEKYSSIYITEISRLGRNPKNTREIIDRLTEINVPIFIQSIGQSTIDTNGKRNIIVSIILQVLMEFADLEAETMKTRMKSGKMQGVKDGKVSGANQAYGYMNENKMLVINKVESAIVEQIFELYKEGNGTRVIANTLNQMDIPTRLATTHKDKTLTFKNTNSEKQGDLIIWNGATIRQIINNTIYIGQRKFKGEIYNSPQLITPELFNECNQLMQTKTHRNYLTSYEYLLKDLIRCGVCGNKYFAKYSPDKGYDKIYKCTSYIKKGCSCGNQSINLSLLESVIYDVLLNSETLINSLDNPKDIMKQVEVDIKTLNQQLLNTESELRQKQSEQERLLDLFLSNPKYKKELFEAKEITLSKEIDLMKEKVKLITKEIFSKTLTIANYNQKTATIEMITNAKHNRPELRSIFKQFISKIIINTLDKKVTLATVYIKYAGLVLPTPIYLFINAGGVRAVRYNSNKKYEYVSTTKLINQPVFKDNILMVDTPDILNEFQSELKYSTETDGMYGKQYTTIDRNNWLYITATDV
jgi:DNA invertase Pin-like site-specific DNA recombinase